MELFEEIRREYEFGVGTIAGVAKKLKVHRRMVREAIGSAPPRPRKKTERPRWKLACAVAFVDGILEVDRKAPRKQRHTAHRIWERMRAEMQECSVCERTVRQYVQARKRALGLVVNEVFVPQSYDWGVEAQVDWYEAVADLAGERTKLQVFSMRSMASGAAFHCAFLHATQQAFLEAHELGFAFFCGVFRKLRYDNLKAAVKKILRGQRREEPARFIAFRSHWRFDSEFCTPAEGHEKGGVEGEAGYFRRNHWVPVPKAVDLAELNRPLLADCRGDEQRCIAGRDQSIGMALLIEQQNLLPLASEGMDLARTSFPTVNSMGCVKVLTNAYSVLLKVGVEVMPRRMPARWKFGRTATVWRCMSAAMAGRNRCSNEALDLTTAAGRAMAAMLAVFASFELGGLAGNGLRAGLAHARNEWQETGSADRAAGLQAAEMRKLHRAGLSKSEIARRLQIGRTSVRRILGARL